jgi:hypothetical protein
MSLIRVVEGIMYDVTHEQADGFNRRHSWLCAAPNDHWPDQFEQVQFFSSRSEVMRVLLLCQVHKTNASDLTFE